MLCGDGIIGVDMVLLVGCDGLRQLRLSAMLQHLASAMTSKSIWTRRDGSAGGSVAQREAPCGELSAAVQTSKASSLHLSFGRDRALSLESNLITSIKPPTSFNSKFLRLFICRWSAVEFPRAVEQLAPFAISAVSGNKHESSYARRCRLGA